METFKALSRGTQLVLLAGPLLIFSLFFTWQRVEVDYGRAGTAVQTLDGFDFWGLLIAVLVLTTVTLVGLQHLTEVKFAPSVPWNSLNFALGSLALVITALKSLTDSSSTMVSYGFVAISALFAFGTYLNWVAERRSEETPTARKGSRVSSAA